jgi:hypothetical protein
MTTTQTLRAPQSIAYMTQQAAILNTPDGDVSRLFDQVNAARLQWWKRQLAKQTALHESLKSDCEAIARKRLEAANAVFQLEKMLCVAAQVRA